MRSHLHASETILFFVTACALCASGAANATPLTLSNSSDDPGVPATALSATLNFELTDPTTLRITISNDTADFDIVSILFNAAPHITGLTLVSAPNGWKLKGDKDRDTDAFGFFDFVVGVGNKDAPEDNFYVGDTAEFEFGILGTGPFSVADFTGISSDIAGGGIAVLAAAKFKNASFTVLGATHTPEPGTALLLGFGLLGLAIQRRRS